MNACPDCARVRAAAYLALESFRKSSARVVDRLPRSPEVTLARATLIAEVSRAISMFENTSKRGQS